MWKSIPTGLLMVELQRGGPGHAKAPMIAPLHDDTAEGAEADREQRQRYPRVV